MLIGLYLLQAAFVLFQEFDVVTIVSNKYISDEEEGDDFGDLQVEADDSHMR